MLRIWQHSANRSATDRAKRDRAEMNEGPGKPMQIVPSYYSRRPASGSSRPKETGVPINPGHSYTPTDSGEGERFPQSGNIGWARNV